MTFQFPAPTADQIARIAEMEARKQRASDELARRRDQQLDGSDCALSDRCDGLNRTLAETEIRILNQGGCEVFPALFLASTGERVRAELVTRNSRFAAWQQETVWLFLNDRGQNRPVTCADGKDRWSVPFHGTGMVDMAMETIAMHERWLAEDPKNVDLDDSLTNAKMTLVSEQRKAKRAVQFMTRIGFTEGKEVAPARAIIGGNGKGLSGLACAFVTVVRDDAGYPQNAVILPTAPAQRY